MTYVIDDKAFIQYCTDMGNEIAIKLKDNGTLWDGKKKIYGLDLKDSQQGVYILDENIIPEKCKNIVSKMDPTKQFYIYIAGIRDEPFMINVKIPSQT